MFCSSSKIIDEFRASFKSQISLDHINSLQEQALDSLLVLGANLHKQTLFPDLARRPILLTIKTSLEDAF